MSIKNSGAAPAVNTNGKLPMEENEEDQRLPHKKNPNQPVPLNKLQGINFVVLFIETFILVQLYSSSIRLDL